MIKKRLPTTGGPHKKNIKIKPKTKIFEMPFTEAIIFPC